MTTTQGFQFLTGDMNWEDYGGKFYRQTGPTTYLIIEILNWEEATGELGHEGATHNASLSEVDLGNEKSNKEACSSCGWEYKGVDAVYDPYLGDDLPALALVEALHGYGHRAPLGDWDGCDVKKLLAKAGREAALLESDHEHYEEQMDRPVNAIGTSARDFRDGNLWGRA